MLWSNGQRWRFFYRPGKLQAVVNEISERYGATATLERRRCESAQVDVKPLLEAIGETCSDEELRTVAWSLTASQIAALFFVLPDVLEPTVIQRVVSVLIWRAKRYLLAHAWSTFKSHPRHPGCRVLLGEVLTRGLGPDLPERYRTLLETSVRTDDPVGVMASHLLGADDLLFDDLLRNMGVERDCPLAADLLQEYVLRSGRKHFLREGGAGLASYVRSFQLPPFKRFAERYLLEMEPQFFQREVTTLILDWLGKPGEPLNRRWDGIDDAARKKFQRWLIESELEMFFQGIAGDQSRWRYWMGQVDRIQDVIRRDDPPILVMFFARGVAVEFGQPGNAAYLYTNEAWRAIYQSLRRRSVWKPQDLKHRSSCLDRIEHRGWWEAWADFAVKQIL